MIGVTDIDTVITSTTLTDKIKHVDTQLKLNSAPDLLCPYKWHLPNSLQAPRKPVEREFARTCAHRGRPDPECIRHPEPPARVCDDRNQSQHKRINRRTDAEGAGM